MPLGSTGKRFNGGAITGGLDITGTLVGGRQLTVEAPVGHSADILRIAADASDPTNTEFVVDQHGNLRILSGGSFQEASLQLLDNYFSPGSITLDTFNGVQIAPGASGGTLLLLSPATAHTGLVFDATSKAGAHTLRVSSDNKLGFYDHAPGAQATLTSGTATPEQIALALQANGFCGGS